MKGIKSILEIEVKGADAIERAARSVHGMGGYFRASSHNTGRYEDAARPTGGSYSGSNWNPAYLHGGGTGPAGPGGFNSGYTPPPAGGAGGGGGGYNAGPGYSFNWNEPNRPLQGVVQSKIPEYISGGGGSGWNPGALWRGASMIGSAAGGAMGAGLGAGYGLVSSSIEMFSSALKGMAGLMMKLVNPGGALQKMVDMFSLSGIMASAHDITQRSFFSNAVGINPNDILSLNATYGRLANPANVLGGIAEARAAPFSLGLATAGISQQEARSMTTEQLTWRMTDLARNYARNPRWGANEMTLGATGLGQFFSVQDLLRIGNISDEEYGEIRSTRSRVEGASKLRDPGAWRHFETERAVGVAGMQTSIQNKLTPLLAPIEKTINNVMNLFNKAGGGNVIDRVMSGVMGFIDKFNELIQADTWKEFWDILKRDAMNVGEYMLNKAKETWDFIWDWAQKKFPETTQLLEDSLAGVMEFGKKLGEMLPTFDQIKQIVNDIYSSMNAFKEWLSRWGFISSANAAENRPLEGLPPDVPGSLNEGSRFNPTPHLPQRNLGPVTPQNSDVETEDYGGQELSQEFTNEDIDNMRAIMQSLPPGAEKERMKKMLAEAIRSMVGARRQGTLDDLRGRNPRGRGEGRGRPYSLGSDDSTTPGTVVRSVPRDARVDIAIRTDNSSNFMLQSMRTTGSVFGGGTGY